MGDEDVKCQVMGFLDDTVVSEMEYDVAVISSSRASENWLFAADVMVLRR